MAVPRPDLTPPGAPPASTAHPDLESASTHLASVLVGNGDLDAVLVCSQVILGLADVYPPLPPLAYPATGPNDLPGIRRAIHAALADLAALIEDVDQLPYEGHQQPTVDETLRAGHASRALQELLTRLEQS